MIPPDTNTMTILFLNVTGWVVIWLRDRNRNAIRDYQHAQMWKQFAKDHNLNGSAKETN